jgi:hypothetical protein
MQKATRNEFLTAVGTVNADILTAGQRGGLVVKTTYPGVADRIHGMARSCELRTLQTVAENEAKPWLPIYVVSVKGFRQEGGR